MVSGRSLLFLLALFALPTACAEKAPKPSRAETAIENQTPALATALAQKGLALGSPLFIQILKSESELRLFIRDDTSRFQLFRTYPVCAWSGTLGPKLREGDGQSPEGFYEVRPSQMNPNSSYHLSFNLGFPNAYDKSLGRTGSFLMVHGKCASIGCYAMTDPVIEEVWTLMTAAFQNGQRKIDVHIYPFAMTEENMKTNAEQEWSTFWTELEPAWRSFEKTGNVPETRAENGHYFVSRNPAPQM